MTDTLKSVIEEELQKAYERGVEDGMKREHAMWQLTAIGQEIEMGITYEEANPPEPYCKRCGKKLGTEAHDVHTCTPKEIQPVAWVVYENGEKHGLDFDEDDIAKLPVGTMLYTAPQKKEWVGLTDEEIREGNKDSWVTRQAFESAVWWAEAKLKEKNG